MEGDEHLKVVVCGAAGVGKSSLLRRLHENTFTENHTATIGINVIIHTVGGMTMQIWDTAGQERFRALVRTYFRGARLILFVFDVSNRLSLELIPQWIADAEWEPKEQLAYLVGTKSDTPPNKRAVPEEEAAEFAREQGMPYMETSARTGARVVELFASVARHLEEHQRRRLVEEPPPPPLPQRGVSLHDPRPQVVNPRPPPAAQGACCK